MKKRTTAIILITLGILGCFLPWIPGFLLIIAGIQIWRKDKQDRRKRW